MHTKQTNENRSKIVYQQDMNNKYVQELKLINMIISRTIWINVVGQKYSSKLVIYDILEQNNKELMNELSQNKVFI